MGNYPWVLFNDDGRLSCCVRSWETKTYQEKYGLGNGSRFVVTGGFFPPYTKGTPTPWADAVAELVAIPFTALHNMLRLVLPETAVFSSTPVPIRKSLHKLEVRPPKSSGNKVFFLTFRFPTKIPANRIYTRI